MENKNFTSLRSEEIVRLLEEPTDDRQPLKQNLQKEASVKELVQALEISRVELTSRILCDILAARRAKTAVPALIKCLEDPSPWLKDDAAEALGKIGGIKAGEALLDHFNKDPRLWYAVAMGEIGYRAAIPRLIEALYDPSPMVRGGAAWALEELIALDALKDLKEVARLEEDAFALKHMEKAIEYISEKKISK
ncbi:MAG: HEAT repeat domain-containing protein [Chloroflexi bacterium]|nr:HEAT repeat domain-containing protein [Chloroflexota bacterium]